MANYLDDISFVPFKKEIAGYSSDTLKQDLLAALSVALLTIPQAMGYALLAGLPLSCGLFAAIFFGLYRLYVWLLAPPCGGTKQFDGHSGWLRLQ